MRILPLLALSLAAGCPSAPATPASDAGSTTACARAADCDDGRFCNGVETCAPDASAADARGCVSGAPPCAASQCDEGGDSCMPGCADADGDGHTAASCGGDDCDDGDANRFTGNTEVCDPMDHDEDCDPRTFGVRDQDHDGEADALCCNVSPTAMRTCGTDCDDTHSTVNTTAPEVCNGTDDDCDTAVDEGVGTAYARDADHDTHGDPMDVMMLCGPTGEYTATLADDCDDADATVFPRAREVCNGRDDDCSSGGGADAAEDADGDMHTASTYTACEATPSSFVRDDCDDENAEVHPGAPFHAEPHGCLSGVPCVALRGTWTCGMRMPASSACVVETVGGGTPSWDYDCSGGGELEPAATNDSMFAGACTFLCDRGFATTCGGCANPMRTGCSTPLTGGPFLIVPGTTCGGVATYRTCGGAACGACTQSDTMGTARCR